MMNRVNIGLGIVNVLIISLLIAWFLNSRDRMVYVDSNKLVNGYKGMQDAKKAYQQKATQWKANVDTLTSELQAAIMKYEKEVGNMTPKEKSLSQELLRQKQKQLGEFQQAMNTKAQQEDGQMTTQVITQINAYLKKYGKKKGYRIIFAATDYGNIAYAEDEMDITEEVLEGLNSEYQGK